MITKCPCLHCGGPIQFEANDLAEDNRRIACPHCKQETSLFIPIHNQTNEMVIRSQGDTLELANDKVLIRRLGVTGTMPGGANGDRVIPIAELAGIQMKPAGTVSGYIFFAHADSEPFTGGISAATQEPNAFIFGQELNEEVANFKWKVEQLMHEFKKHAATSPPKNALVEELRALAELKQQGLLTAEEFEAAKKKLLT